MRPVSSAAPKISIVTPSYNQGIFLETCIKSVLSQNYPNLEYIIIDGGSQDNSPALLQQYQPQLTYWVSEPDQGQSDAINKGLSHASGDLVAWLNADDFYLPGALAEVAQAYQVQPDAPFYFGNGLRVDEQGQPKRVYFGPNSLRFNLEALRLGLNYILQPATFISRPALQQIGGLAVNLHYGMDTDLWLRLAHLGQPVIIPAQLAASREYTQTKTASGSFARIEELRQIAQQHSGQPITPGIICYFLDTLNRQAQEQPQLFPPAYRRHILRFWTETSLLMDRFGAGPDGFPLPEKEAHSRLHHLKRATWVRLKNFVKAWRAG